MLLTDPSKFKHKVALSASKIDSFLHCSQKYAARYLYNLPDLGNSGSSRGSVVHEILELLVKDKYRSLVRSILLEKNCRPYYALWKLIRIKAKKYQVCDDENLALINDFILVALENEFYGPPKTEEILVEKDFDFEYFGEGKDYRIRGKIDKIFICKDSIFIDAVDFKTSKAKFDKDKIENSVQAGIYQLVIKFLFPKLKLRSFKFIFLKFTNKPIQEFKLFSDAALNGFEYYLTQLQDQIESFNITNIGDNLGAQNPKMFRLCGKEGVKEDGTAHFICPARKPQDYYVLIENNQVMGSAFNAKELKTMHENNKLSKIEKRHYNGCLWFFNEKGVARKLNLNE